MQTLKQTNNKTEGAKIASFDHFSPRFSKNQEQIQWKVKTRKDFRNPALIRFLRLRIINFTVFGHKTITNYSLMSPKYQNYYFRNLYF